MFHESDSHVISLSICLHNVIEFIFDDMRGHAYHYKSAEPIVSSVHERIRSFTSWADAVRVRINQTSVRVRGSSADSQRANCAASKTN